MHREPLRIDPERLRASGIVPNASGMTLNSFGATPNAAGAALAPSGVAPDTAGGAQASLVQPRCQPDPEALQGESEDEEDLQVGDRQPEVGEDPADVVRVSR